MCERYDFQLGGGFVFFPQVVDQLRFLIPPRLNKNTTAVIHTEPGGATTTLCLTDCAVTPRLQPKQMIIIMIIVFFFPPSAAARC